MVNKLSPTTAPGPNTLRQYTDNPTITLKAEQTGSAAEASFVYNWLAACGTGGAPRLGVGSEPTAMLQVKLLGNPVHNTVEVEVIGAQGALLQLSLTDMLGRNVGESRTEQAGVTERYQFNVSTQAAGPLVLRVNTNAQSKTVRLLKVN